jgi:hypothetical protein
VLKRFMNALGVALTYPAYRRFVWASKNGALAQEKAWKECLSKIQNGSYWKKRYEMLPSRLEDFPISEFSDYVEAHREAYRTSTESPLTGEKLIYWAMSSGTTGVEKYFPITRSHVKQVTRTSTALFHRRFLDFPYFLDGRSLIPSDPESSSQSPLGIPTGSISTFGYMRTPKFLRSFISIPVEIMANREIFNQWAALYALSADTQSIFAMTPFGLCRFFESAKTHQKLYLDVLEGRVKPPVKLEISEKRRKEVITHLQADRIYVNRVWPNLRFASVWKSSICASQLPRLESYFDPGTSRGKVIDSVYAATEGWFNVPGVGRDDLGGPHHLGAHVFEYLPLDRPAEAKSLLKPWQLKVGENYELVLTNAMGLVRYRIKDVVRVLGFFNQSPVISFQYKSQNLLRLASVTLDESEIAEAILEATQNPEPFVGVFTVDPKGGDRIVVFYSSAMKYGKDQVPLISKKLDQALIRKNFEYRYDREGNALRPLIMIESPADHPVFQKVGASEIKAQAKMNYILPLFPASAEALYQDSLG